MTEKNKRNDLQREFNYYTYSKKIEKNIKWEE